MNRRASCACGDVKVTVKGEPQICWACHCDDCQRATGSIALFAAMYLEEDIVSIEGSTTTFDNFPKYPGAEKYFCKTCGTTVHWINPVASPGMHMIAPGCFEDPNFLGPQMVFQTQYRPEWCPEFKSVTQSFEGFLGDEGT